MPTLPVISIKSKTLQADLGVKTPRSARRKLMAFGARIIDGEYVSVRELQQLTDQKLSGKVSPLRGDGRGDWTKDTPFEDLTD